MLSRLRPHKLAILTAVFIALIYGLPNIFFIASLGDAYRGIPMLQTPNEASYLARIQEVLDGHEALGSPFFFEYKDAPPLSPPTGEWLYALPSLLFGITPAATLILSKFILPAILFLLVYAVLLRLTGDGGLPHKLNAIACGLLIVLGYDLVDYRTVLSYLTGASSPGSFLLWARPVHPILGGIFFFSFLLSVLALVQNTPRQKSALAAASLLLALMFSTYFFSWGTALSVLAALVIIFLARREYRVAAKLAFIAPLGALFAAPYWYSAWLASQSPLYESAVLRSGLFLTHYPLLNKLLLAAFLAFLIVLVIDFFWKRRKQGPTLFPIQSQTFGEGIEMWHLFCLALLLGGLWTYSQQILTGRTIWPYHFVQYTIPLAMVAGFALLFNTVRAWHRYLWGALAAFAAASSLWFGVYTEISAYTSSKPAYANMQGYAPLFDLLNEREKDCVVFVNETSAEMSELNTLLPAFTHCNRYVSTELFVLIPEDRGPNNYLALLRLRGISSDAIEAYLHEHQSEAAGYLYSNWQGLFGVKDFPDFSDPLLTERLAAFPREYREFLKKDFKTELQKYRIDYILSLGPLDVKIIAQLPNVGQVFEQSGLILYFFR